MQNKKIILMVIIGCLILTNRNFGIAQNQQTRVLLTKLKEKYSLDNSLNQFNFNLEKNATIAGVRGAEINISKTFEPYWKGGITDTQKQISQNSNLRKTLETLEDSLNSGDFAKSEKLINEINSGTVPGEVREFIALKNIILKLAQDKKIAALKSANEYLSAYPLGCYRQDIEQLREAIYCDDNQ